MAAIIRVGDAEPAESTARVDLPVLIPSGCPVGWIPASEGNKEMAAPESPALDAEAILAKMRGFIVLARMAGW